MALRESKNDKGPAVVMDRQPRINPELDARLTAYMEANANATQYCTNLVKNNPDRAVRTMMMSKMLKHEDQMRLVEKQLPQVEQWVKEQPGMMEKIKERIKNVLPVNQTKAFVNEAMRMKSRMDFTPRVGAGVGASVST